MILSSKPAADKHRVRASRIVGPLETISRLVAQDENHYPRFRNDRAVPEICIGVKEFKCIGVSPPHDHPHVYINMREADTILCPYCATRFRFDPRLTPLSADPPDSRSYDSVSPETPLLSILALPGITPWPICNRGELPGRAGG